MTKIAKEAVMQPQAMERRTWDIGTSGALEQVDRWPKISSEQQGPSADSSSQRAEDPNNRRFQQQVDQQQRRSTWRRERKADQRYEARTIRDEVLAP